MIRHSRILLALSAIALLCSLSVGASAADLGAANGYNVFVLGDLTQTGGTTAGGIAVGGDASVTSATVSSLVVGDDLTITGGGSITSGGIVTGGNTNIPAYYYTNYSVQHNSSSLPVDFASAADYLLDSSSYLGSLASNGTTSSLYNKITLTGTDSTLNIFTVSADQLSTAWGLYVDVPTGSTVVVNVTGSAVSWGSGVIGADSGYTLDGSKIVYNFSEADTLSISSLSVIGSVLAPTAAVTFTGGNLAGTLVAGSLVESHVGITGSTFTGSLPTTTATPEPSTVAALGIGLTSVLGAAWRKRKGSIG